MDDTRLVCQDCGTTESVTETLCPYARDVHDDEVYVTICDDCYHERCMDI